MNMFEMQLSDDVFDQLYDEVSSESENEETNDSEVHSAIVEIDISKSAYANARRYFDSVRFASQKEHKTIEASKKAFENAERATQQSLKQIDVSARIEKLRKSFWFEKFLWFISSDNFVVIGGHDQQQNGLLVKKYLNKGDLYVHADIHGATSVIVKNPKDIVVSLYIRKMYKATCFSVSVMIDSTGTSEDASRSSFDGRLLQQCLGCQNLAVGLVGACQPSLQNGSYRRVFDNRLLYGPGKAESNCTAATGDGLRLLVLLGAGLN